MSRTVAEAVAFCNKLDRLLADQAIWSQETFGSDIERDALGSLKHLQREAVECQRAVGTDHLLHELGDAFLLVQDAARRGGYNLESLVDQAIAKTEINKARKWPKAVAGEPVEHIREEADNDPEEGSLLDQLDYEDIEGLFSALPVSWIPALMREFMTVAIRRNVYQPGALVRIALQLSGREAYLDSPVDEEGNPAYSQESWLLKVEESLKEVDLPPQLAEYMRAGIALRRASL